MKKLLSICFLSILLTLAGFVAQAQSTTPCCFWLENMNPQTVQDISNLGNAPGSPALLPGYGNPIVLNNTMTPVTNVNVSAVQNEPWNVHGTAGDRTDWYLVHVKNCGDANTKVSLEWKLYNNGVLIPDANLSDYVDLFIYTKFDEMAHTNSVNATCGHSGWLGGPITGESTCREVASPINGLVNCLGGYPGAAVVDNTTTFTSNSFFASGYTQLPAIPNSYNGSTGYNLDYFYLPFFESSETRIALRWRQVGNYSLVVNLRERVGGTDWQIWSDETQNAVIGGHQSCCGNIIATDSIHYLVTEDFSKEVCDGSSFTFGRPEASYSVQGDYNVVFGDYVCDHFKIEKLSYLHFFVRENPEVVVAKDLIEKCYGESFTQADLAELAQFAEPDAAGLCEKEFQWSVDGGATFTTTVPTPSTEVGTYEYYVRQVNTYYNFPADAEVKDTIICEGPAKKITYIIHEIPEVPQITDAADYYCVGATAVTVADHAVPTKVNYDLRWSMVNTFDPEITGDALIPATTAAGVQNFYVYQIDTVTGCFDKANYDSVVVTVYANPVLQAAAAPKADCLGEEFTLSVTPDNLTTYSWKEDDVEFATTPVTKVTPTKAGVHVYTVDVTEDHLIATEVVATCAASTTDTIEVYPLPTVPVFAENSKSYCLNDLEGTYTIKSTTEETATTIWFNAAKDSIYTGADLTVNIEDIKPAGNEFGTVKYYAIAYNPTTGCYSDTVDFTFHFNMYPVVTLAPDTQYVCPGSRAEVLAEITTPSTPNYTYFWTGVVKSEEISTEPTAELRQSAIVETSEEDCTGTQYSVSVFVIDADGNGCQSSDATAIVIVKDETIPVLSSYSSVDTLEGCDFSVVPAAYTTVAELEAGENITVTDECGKLVQDITYEVERTALDCYSYLVRTYTITDNCGNDTTYKTTYYIHDVELPVISTELTQIAPISATDCKFNLPEDDVFVALLEGNVSDNCATPEQLMSSIVLTNGTTTPINSANTDIFAATDTVDIYAQITDLCGNKTQTKIAYLVKPTPMFIHHGSVSALPDEICLHDTVMLAFAVDSIDGYAHAPYSFVWSGKPNDGSIIHHTLLNAYGVPAHANDDYVYTITVTDKFGCQAKDSSESVHVWDLPTVTIHEDIRNGATFPLCPNYGVLTVVAVAEGRVPEHNEIANYTWSGESVNIYSHKDTTGVYVIPDSCNHAYNAHVVVENVKGCVAHADFPFMALDEVAPQVIPASTIKDSTLVRQAGCKFVVPDFIPLFSNDNVVDNCYRYGTFTVTQNPVAGEVINQNTPVTIQFTDPCGNTGYYIINANIPTDNITVTNVAIVNPAFCLGGSATLSPSLANATATPLAFAWTENGELVSEERNFEVTPETYGVHTYTFTVTDANDCESAFDTIVTVYRLPEESDVTLQSTPNNYCDGVYNVDNVVNGTVSVSDLTAGFQYKLSTDNEWRDADYIYTGLRHGEYFVDLKSDHDCITLNAAKVTVDSVDITVLSTAVGTPNIRCEAPYNGTITVINPQVDYTYEIINLPNTERVYTDGDLVYESLLDGDYAIHVVTDKYCPYIIYNTEVKREVVYPSLPEYVATAQTSCVNPNGSLTIRNTVADYQYTFGIVTKIGSGTDVTFDNLNGGSYTLTIKSTEGCESQFYGIIVPTTQVTPERPEIDSVANTVCDLSLTPNGSIKVLNPIQGYTYAMNGQSFTYDAASGVEVEFVNLIDANNHLMTITSELGCAYTYTYELPANITLPAVPEFTITDNTVCMNSIPSCVAVSNSPTYNGTLVINNPDDTHFAYTLTTVPGASIINPVSGYSYENLNPGNYVLSVRDLATGCVKDSLVEILDAAVPVEFADEYTTTPRTSCTQTNGCININPVENYEYFICAVQNSPLTGASNLDAGKYIVFKYNTLTGCSREDTVVVPDGRARYDTIKYDPISDITCDDNLIGTGSITVTNLSSSDFTFYINGARNANNIFNNLQDGEYTIAVVHNATQCPGESKIVVAEDVVNPVIKSSTTPNTICTPNVFDGTIAVTAPEQNCQYVVLNANNDTVGTGISVEELANGEYYIVATNVLTGCVGYDTVEVANEPVMPFVTAIDSTANYTCIETARNGSVTLSSTVPTVTYYLVQGEDTINSVDPVFTNLNSGKYEFFAISNKGCVSNLGVVSVPDSAHIYNFAMHSEPNKMCDGTFEHPGSGRIIVDSPRARFYDYSFYDAAGEEIDVNYFNPDSYTMYHLKDQLYRVVITDINTTCSLTDTITVPLKLDNIVVTADSTNNDRCEAPYSGTVTVTVSNPTTDGVYRYSIDGGSYQVSPVFTALQEGKHFVTVWDTTTNCVYPAEGALEISVEKTNYTVELISTVHDNEFCVAPFNGAVTLSAMGTNPNASYEFDFNNLGFSATTDYTQLAAGLYPVSIKDVTSGCVYETLGVAINTVNDNLPLVTITSQGHNNASDSSFCYDAQGKLIANVMPVVSSDTLGYTFAWTDDCHHVSSDSNSVDVYTHLEPGTKYFCCTYSLEVNSIATGCKVLKTRYVCVDSMPDIKFYAENPTFTRVPKEATVMNCENADITVGIMNPLSSLDSISWTNGHVAQNVTSFVDTANKYVGGQRVTYCVYVIDNNGCTATSFMNLSVNKVPRETIAKSACDSIEYISQTGVNYKFRYNDDTSNVYTIVDTFNAVNGCDSIVTYTYTLNTSPSLVVDSTRERIEQAVCHGTALMLEDGITATATTHFGWKIVSSQVSQYDPAHTDFDPTTATRYADNGKFIYAYAYNGCDTLISELYTLHIDSLPKVGRITSNSPYCYNASFDIEQPQITWNNQMSLGTTKWQFNGVDSNMTHFVYAMNNGVVRFAATNACGTSYSNEDTLTVYNQPSVTRIRSTIVNDSICVGSSDTIYYALNTDNLHKYDTSDNGFSVKDVAGQYIVITADSVVAPLSKITIVAHQDADFTCASDTLVVEFAVVGAPVIDTLLAPDSVCAGNAFARLVAPNVNPMNSNIYSKGWFIDSQINGAFNTPFDPTTKLHVSDNGKYIKYAVVNRCDTVYSNAVRIVVDTLATASLETDPTNFCAGAVMTADDFNLEDPTETATAPITTDPYMVFGGTIYNGAPLTMADSNRSLIFKFGNRCGYSSSNSIKIHVHDTASLILNLANMTDSICVGAEQTFVAKTHKSNIITVSSLDTAYIATIVDTTVLADATVYTIKVAGADATAADKSAIAIKVEAAYASCINTKFDTVRFVVTDTAHIAALADIDGVCEGSTLSLTAPSFTTPNTPVVDKYWQTNVTGAWTRFTSTTPMSLNYRGKNIRYAVETRCGTVYSNTQTITVYDTVKLSVHSGYENYLTQEICSDEDSAFKPVLFVIDTASDKTTNLNTLDIRGLSFGYQGGLPGNCRAYSLNNAYLTFGPTSGAHGTYKIVISASSVNCPATNKTDTVTLMIDSVPAITFNVAEQTYCIGETPNFKVGEVVTLNSYDVADSAVVGHIKLYDPATRTYGAWSDDLPAVITAAYDSAYVAFTAKNHCAESPIYDSLLVIVKGSALVDVDPKDTMVCAGSQLIDFIKTPAHYTLPTGSTTVTAQGWAFKTANDTVFTTSSAVIDNDTTVLYYVATACDTAYSNPVRLHVTPAPEITSVINPDQFTICSGKSFIMPSMTYINEALDTIITWTIAKVNGDPEILDFNAAYDTAYNGATISFIVTNECLADTVETTAIVHNLPVPQLLADTNICSTGTAHLTVNPSENDAAYTTYMWYMDDNMEDVVCSTKDYDYVSDAEGVHTFTVVVTDANGCVSVRNENATVDTESKLYKSDKVTVSASDLPRFIFRDVNGNETHRLPDAVTSLDMNTNYTWEVSTPCFNGNQLVFVTFDIYHNGSLIENNQIGEYLMERLVNPTQSQSQKWVTSDMISWYTYDRTPVSVTTNYDFASGNNSTNVNMGNHYPNTRFNGGAGADMFDDVYLHFLNQRPVSKTIAPFVQAGDYKIIYTLYYVDNTNELQDLYHNEFSDVNLKIGGRNSLGGDIHAMVVDTIKINVTGETQHYSHVVNPEPEPEPIVDNPTDEPKVKLYPNPNSSDMFYAAIEGLEGATKIKLVNILGTVISEETIMPTKSTIYTYSRKTTDLAPGIYTVYLEYPNGVVSRKLVVTK